MLLSLECEPVASAPSPPRGGSPNLDQYFGLWAANVALPGMVGAMKLLYPWGEGAGRLRGEGQATAGYVGYMPGAAGRRAASGEKRIAQIDLLGLLTKDEDWLFGGTSTIWARDAIAWALADESVGAILLRIDSQGGTLAGTADLADDVFRANRQKPVTAYLEDMCCSAAYWIAAQAGELIANARTALVGSIGTFTAIYDASLMAERRGIKAVVIKSGKYKGIGVPGSEVTEEHQAHLQYLVDSTQEQFDLAVARGRKMSVRRVQQLADGRALVAPEALAAALIDGIGSIDAVVSRMRQRMGQPALSSFGSGQLSVVGGQCANPNSTAPKVPAASYQQVKAACPGAGPDFLASQLELSATVEHARTAWMAEQARQLQEHERELAGLKPATADQLRAACVGSDEKFVRAQLDAGASVDRAQQAWMVEQGQRLAWQRQQLEIAQAGRG